MEGTIYISIGYMALSWVLVTMLTSVLHKYEISKLDKYLCQKCITFWLTLIISQDVFVAAVASLLAYLFDKYINTNTTTIL